jgi:hypothetical protein
MYRICSNIIRVSQVGGAGGEDEQGDDGLNADERAEARREEELKKSNFVFVQETNEDTIFDNHEMSAEVGPMKRNFCCRVGFTCWYLRTSYGLHAVRTLWEA